MPVKKNVPYVARPSLFSLALRKTVTSRCDVSLTAGTRHQHPDWLNRTPEHPI